MKRLDLDDLPPKLASLLTGLAVGEELLLVQNGVVAGRITGGGAEPEAASAEPELPPEANAQEVFEQFRSMMEDEF